jgi:hypothetical protein
MSTPTKSKKKLDIFNLFYSGAAVVILIGVIAKLLEWPAQDLLITLGLSIEAVVFGVSAIKFVEVEKATEVATEATLIKVADGLGSIKEAVGNDYSNTYVNIQTGAEGLNGPADYKKIASNKTENIGSIAYNNNNDTSNGDNITIKINPPSSSIALQSTSTSTSSISAPGTHSLSQLENLDILSLAKDLFYQPEWNRFFEEEYVMLSDIFKRVFDKKIPTKEALAVLGQFPIKLPVPSMADIVLDKPHVLSLEEIELLYTAFDIIKVKNLFDYFVFEEKEGECVIRNKKAKELVIFGGEDDLILAHCKTFYGKEIVITPNVPCIKTSIKIKDQVLIDHLIQKLNIKNEDEFISLVNILHSKDDETKRKIFGKFKKVIYDVQTETGYIYLKTLVQLSVSFNDISLGNELFKNIIEFQIDDKLSIVLDDLVNHYAETIYFGPKNEYSVVLNEIFINNELNNVNYINTTIDKLSSDNIASKSKLLELFNLKEQDSKSEIFKKLNYHLAKNNTAPTGSQLAFILLFKQYN